MASKAEYTPSPEETPPPAPPSIGRTILRNTLFVSTGGGIIRLLTFLFTIYVVRKLGDSAYGQYLTALALTAMFGILFELGTTQYLERTVAQQRSRLNELLPDVIGVRLVLAFAGIFLVTGLAVLLGYDRIIVLSVLLLTISYISAALLYPLQTVFTSHERFDLWTSTLVIGQVLTIILGFLVLWLGGGLVWFLTTGMIVMPIQILYCWFAIRRLTEIGNVDLRPRLNNIKPLLLSSLPFALAALALTISFNIDTFLLSLMEDSSVVGWYGAAYRLVPTVVSILGGFLTVITPSLARAYATDAHRVGPWVATSTKWLAIFGIAAAAGLSILSVPIVSLLFGEAFAPAAAVLAIIAWDIPFRLYNAFSGNVSNAINLERTSWRFFMTGAILGIVAYIPAIHFFGMYGAAVVTVVCDAIVTILFLILMHKELAAVRINVLLRVLAATAAMALCVYYVEPHIGLLPRVAVGVLVYGALCFALGLIDMQTVRKMASFLPARWKRR